MAQKKVFWLFIALALVNLTLGAFIPIEESVLARYNVTPDQMRFLRLTLTIPIMAIWFIGFYGFAKFKHYSEVVAKSSEGPGLNKIAQGLLVLALWLPITSIIGNVASYITYNHREYIAPTKIIDNYIDVAIVLLALYLLFQGSKLLIGQVKKISIPRYNIVKALFLTMSLFFVYWTLTNPVRQFPADENSTAAYYLPDWLLIPTIIIPYLAAFYFGIQAVHNILLYRYKAKGVLYRRALSSLAYGIGVIVTSVIAVRYLSAFTTYINDAALKIILLIVYCLIFLIAAGYILIAMGAKKLHKIEEA